MEVGEPSRPNLIRLISQHQPAIFAYILTLHPSRNEANDVLQETNVVIWEKLGTFREGSNFKAWAFRIAYLQLLAHFKRKKRGRWLGFSSDLVDTLASEAEPLLEDFEDRHRALRGCIEKLTEADRDILASHYESDLPLSAVAARLGRSIGAMKQVLHRVRRTLRTCVEKQLSSGGFT